jgi:two-component system chemotaxis sensor kinase CheA
MTVPVVLLVGVVAMGAYYGLVRTSRLTAMQSKQAAAEMVVKLTARSVMPAVVFADDEEMKRAVADLANSSDVTDVELWGNGPDAAGTAASPLVALHRPGGKAIGRPKQTKPELTLLEKSVRVIQPVISPEGTTVGMLAVRFSTAREARALEDLSRQVLYVSLASAACFTLALLLVLHRLVLAPIRRLQLSAKRLAEGDEREAQRVVATSSRIEDEVVRLGHAFYDMAGAVQDREHRLGVRNTDLKLILDSVDQGFLTALPDGTLLPERSRIVQTWVGELPESCTLWDLADRLDPNAAGWMQMAWLQVADGVMPLEVAIDQLPKRLVRGDRHFDFAYHPVESEGQLERMIIVLTDVTADVERQRAVAEQHEFSVLVDQFVSDRHAFLDFWREATALVGRIVEPDVAHVSPEALRRDIHTLKGNSRSFGLTRLSGLCHELEDSIQGRGEKLPTSQELLALRDAWEALRVRMDPIIQGANAFVEISQEEYERLVASVQSGAAPDEIERRLRELRQEPTAWRLKRAKTTLQALAKRLGKAPFEVTTTHNELRLPSERFAPFWSVFPHILNNAADHGIESDEDRKALAKPLPGRIALSTQLVAGELLVRVSDDGSGIDWEAVRAKAKERKLPHETRRDLENALLADGVSLKANVSEVSGRGVGLAAVATVVRSMGGRVEVESDAHAGTTWRFRFPDAKANVERPQRPVRVAATTGRSELTEREPQPGRKPDLSVG